MYTFLTDDDQATIMLSADPELAGLQERIMNGLTRKERNDVIVALAQEDDRLDDGVLEVDDETGVSEDDETNGAYVMAWLWVDFERTELDKEANP